MRKFLLLLAGAASLLLSGCAVGTFGSQPAPVPPVTPPALSPPAMLDGNWFLTGARPPLTALPTHSESPVLSASLFITGTQVTGELSFDASCTAGTSLDSTGGLIPLNGTIANDGTFSASAMTPAAPGTPFGTFQLQLSGNSPTKAAPALWTGSYTLTATFTPSGTATGCTLNRTGTFVAAPISPLTGTYTGPASNGLLQQYPFGKAANVTVVVGQGAPVLVTRGLTTAYQIPLTASISFAGSPCATTGMTSATVLLPSQIAGDTVNLPFRMADGSELTVLGNLADASAAAINVGLAEGLGSPCAAGASMTTLTRQ